MFVVGCCCGCVTVVVFLTYVRQVGYVFVCLVLWRPMVGLKITQKKEKLITSLKERRRFERVINTKVLSDCF